MQEKLLRVWPRRDPYYRAYEPTTLQYLPGAFLMTFPGYWDDLPRHQGRCQGSPTAKRRAGARP
jgi:hypothetical protein